MSSPIQSKFLCSDAVVPASCMGPLGDRLSLGEASTVAMRQPEPARSQSLLQVCVAPCWMQHMPEPLISLLLG